VERVGRRLHKKFTTILRA